MNATRTLNAGRRGVRPQAAGARHPHRRAGLSLAPDSGLPDAEGFRIGLLIPTSGAAGIWGPSCLASAVLAAEAWNAAGGVNGREVHLTVLDASDESLLLEDEVDQMLQGRSVDALVGMHTSSVRNRIARTVRSQVPFVYTPLYEGGVLPAGVMAIGETPQRQLLPALSWLSGRYRLRRWYLVGNDYCWPHRSHALAARALTAGGSEVVGNRFVPLGSIDVERLIDEIRASGAQAVLMSLVGQDAIDFSRAFGESGLAHRVLRLSCAMEENGLLAIGPDHTDGLFVSAGYFATLPGEANAAFRERYWSRFGERAPMLNALGQSTYEGVSFLRGLFDHRRPAGATVAFDSVRATRWRSNVDKATPIYLAQAEGLTLKVVRSLDNLAS